MPDHRERLLEALVMAVVSWVKGQMDPWQRERFDAQVAENLNEIEGRM